MTPEQRAALDIGEIRDCSLISLDLPRAWQLRADQKTEADKQELRDRGLWLSALQRMTLDEKIDYAIKIIQQAGKALPMEQWACSYSGGKDSTIVSHLLVETLGLRPKHVMSNTRSEYADSIRQTSRRFAELRTLGIVGEYALPEETPKTLWKKIGVPVWSKELAGKYRKFQSTGNENILRQVPARMHEQFRLAKEKGLKITDTCCHHLKKVPMKKWDKVNGIKGHFMGVRVAESQSRRMAALQRGFLYYSTDHSQWLCNPLGPWTDADVWAYLERFDMTKLFPRGKAGSGCVNCAFGAHLYLEQDQPNPLQLLWVTDRRKWTEAVDEWGYREVFETLGFPLIPTDTQLETIRRSFRDGGQPLRED